MARDSVAGVSACRKCGSKMSATADRCPRCRAHVARVDPEAQARSRARLMWIAGGILAVFAVSLGGLWLTREPIPPDAAAVAAPVDPFAARRQPAADEPEASTAPAAGAEPARPFLDPSGAGTVAYGSGDYTNALGQFEEAITRNPKDAEALSNFGQILVRLDRTTEALPYFERAMALNPDRWAYRFNYARALGLAGRWDEAIAAYKLAQRLFPDDYVTTFNLALALHKKGDEPAAVEEYKKAVALQPNDASFRMALAISYERMQRKQEAAAEYGEYLRLAPTADDAEKVKAKIAQLSQG